MLMYIIVNFIRQRSVSVNGKQTEYGHKPTGKTQREHKPTRKKHSSVTHTDKTTLGHNLTRSLRVFIIHTYIEHYTDYQSLSFTSVQITI